MSCSFAAAAGAMLGVGWLAMFSIGALLLAAGVSFGLAASKVADDATGRSAALPLVVGAASLVTAPALLLWIT